MNISNKRKIAIIGTVGLPANYGGFETLTDHLVDSLSKEYDMTVYCSGKTYKKEERKKYYKGAKLTYIPLKANGIQSIFYDTISIIHSMIYADVMLILGVSGAWILPFVKWFTNKKIIISIDGIEWKRNKWSTPAKWYLWWAESIAVKYSHFDISDNESIQDYTAIRYGSLSNVIEYGGDHTLEITPSEADLEDYSFLKNPYAFKVCRIEPENNVHKVLEVFSQIPDSELVIIGNWKKSNYGVNLVKEYSKFKNLYLLDPIYHQRTLDLIRGNAAVYIHGHSAGGTNPSLVEAMYLGLPIISNGVSYNKTTTENKALYFNTTSDLLGIIKSINQDQLDIIGAKMKEIAKRRYNWEVITKKYKFLVEKAFEVKVKQKIRPIFSKLSYKEFEEAQASHLMNQHYFFEK